MKNNVKRFPLSKAQPDLDMKKKYGTCTLWWEIQCRSSPNAFEEIPDDWVCPVCGVGKDMFEAQ